MTTDPGADEPDPASFRDPSGQVFRRAGVVHRRVDRRYAAEYDRLMDGGLYADLVQKGLMLPHEEVAGSQDPDAHRILRPQPLPFVSYPYEWCTSQLRDAALITLDVMGAALARGMALKDASAFNVQFLGGRPVFIDTLSFEVYREGEPWVAYRQFCEHFVAPLALACYRDPRLLGLLRAHLDGIPLPLASPLLPRRTLLRFGLLSHVHLHAHAQGAFGQAASSARRVRVSRRSLLALLDSLRRCVAGLALPATASAWSDYEATCTYSTAGRQCKEDAVRQVLGESPARLVLDLGANIGTYSRLAAAAGAFVASIDADPAVVESSYLRARADGNARLLPLVMDLTNPSPGLGWEGRERRSLESRGPADLVLALALVHHLALGGNVPLGAIAAWLRRLGRRAVVEFVPKEDPQAQRLLAVRRDVFDRYDRGHLETALAAHFALEPREVPGSGRILFLCRERQ